MKQAWKIVPFRNGHLPGLRRVFLESRRAAFHWLPADSFHLLDLDAMIEGESILVAAHGDDPIGFISWWPPGDFIHHLFVVPKWHRSGIGRALLADCLQRIGRPAQLKCLCQNAPAIAFYQNQGWEIESKETGANGDCYLMSYRE